MLLHNKLDVQKPSMDTANKGKGEVHPRKGQEGPNWGVEL
jgi:hypothetical protein